MRRAAVAAIITASAWSAGNATDAAAQEACRPVAERTGDETGCWIVASVPLGRLPLASVYWHLDTYATRSEAEAARDTRGSVVEAFGRIWLLTVAQQDWRASGGTHVATIGPLSVELGSDHTAQYMEAVFRPGMTSAVHRHPGPEAWYTTSGEICLETPAGRVVGRAGGEPVIVPAGPPMQLTAIGTEVRRSLVLILHDSSEPAGVPVHDWIPRGLCRS